MKPDDAPSLGADTAPSGRSLLWWLSMPPLLVERAASRGLGSQKSTAAEQELARLDHRARSAGPLRVLVKSLCRPTRPVRRTLGSAVLVLALALPAGARAQDGGLSDAGTRWSDPLYEQCPAAPPSQPVDGGSFHPTARDARLGCLMVTCDERRLQLEPKPGAPPVGLRLVDLVLIAAGLVLGLGLGGWGGWELARLVFGR